VTSEVAEALAAADAERLRIARAYGVAIDSLEEWFFASYGRKADSLRECIVGNPAYAGILAPNTLVHRYLLEDVPTGLIPMLELGRAAGIAAPMMQSLVNRAAAALEGHAWQQPRTLRALGIDGLSCRQIRARLEESVVARPAIPATECGVQA
jgi:opine dehydrogenase